jgi:hypothetical protein
MSTQGEPRVARRFVEIIVLCIGTLACVSLAVEQSFGQDTPMLQSRDAAHAAQPSCVILERMGTVGQVESRVLSLGVRGSEFQFVEGKLPEGVVFHNKLTEHDVRKLQASGADVFILDSDYMSTALMAARESCLKAARKAAAPVSVAQVEIASSPTGSDIEIDGKFVGSTPSLVKVPTGEHTVKLTKNGFVAWERTLTAMPGSVRISPDLQPAASSMASTSSEDSVANQDTVANNRF